MQDIAVQKASSREMEMAADNLLRPPITRLWSQNSLKSTTEHGNGNRRRSSVNTLASRQPLTTSTKIDWKADWDNAPNAPSLPQPDDEWSTPEDIKDMLRMGKRQEMKRVFNQYSLICFGVLCQSTWEFVLLNNTQALRDGGPALLFWAFIWSFTGTMFITASLAEMCSMSPTMAGQYHWVSEFASVKWQKFLSYVTGWLATIGWQIGNASGVLLASSLLQTFIALYRGSESGWAWQSIVLGIPCVVFLILMTIYSGRTTMVVMNATFMLHVLSWVALLVVLWVLAPHVPAHRALLQLKDNGNWPNLGVAILVGQSNINFNVSYTDSVVHMSEEVHDASIAVPRAMMWTVGLGGLMGFVMSITFAFCVPDALMAIDSPTGWPFIYVMDLTASRGVTVFFMVVLILLLLLTCVGFAAATARALYAFARDGGLPFSPWIAKINQRHLTPINAVCVTGIFTSLLSLIYLGSMNAYYGVLSFGQIAQSAGYLVPIACVLWRRIKYPHTLPRARWSLEERCGRSGAIFINAVAVLYAFNMIVWALPPSQLPVTSGNFNVAPSLFAGAMILMLVTYHFQAKKIWVGPVVHTRIVPEWNVDQFGTGQNLQFVTIPEEFENST